MSQQSFLQDAAPEKSGVKWGRVLIWGAVGAVLVFLALGLVNSFISQPQSGKAPEFTLQTYDGQSIQLADLRGQVVVINFWASWCGPCAEEAPDLEQAYQDYKDRGVTFLGIAYVDSEVKSLDYLSRYGITYPNGPDLRSQISDMYHIRGVPETFVVDRNGNIVYFAMQPLTYAELTAQIEKAMAQ
jgi:cytochrome c biogenesis protein CcmG/thiol:disulfide interchange protein DsbE